MTAAQARALVLRWATAYRVLETTQDVLQGAMDLAGEHSFNIWDAVIFTAAANAGCRVLLSEDMHDGFTWHGTTIVNPYAAKPHPLLRPFLR